MGMATPTPLDEATDDFEHNRGPMPEKKLNRKQRRARAAKNRKALKKMRKDLERQARRRFEKIKAQQAKSPEEALPLYIRDKVALTIEEQA